MAFNFYEMDPCVSIVELLLDMAVNKFSGFQIAVLNDERLLRVFFICATNIFTT